MFHGQMSAPKHNNVYCKSSSQTVINKLESDIPRMRKTDALLLTNNGTVLEVSKGSTSSITKHCPKLNYVLLFPFLKVMIHR